MARSLTPRRISDCMTHREHRHHLRHLFTSITSTPVAHSHATSVYVNPREKEDEFYVRNGEMGARLSSLTTSRDPEGWKQIGANPELSGNGPSQARAK
ncbi:hypothetical protein AND_000767 [Anopheles darlingi]|uniref:Uncharacterized protein n=1 Tax=Anopheles darlingi TaxID=43151 RepID=W5JWN3_ANODA|nr:hypothetical protein AND_000767 [Anopheles darlingi]